MRLLTSLSILLAISALAAAAPTVAQPVGAEETASFSDPSAERVALARRFVEATNTAASVADMFRAGFWNGAWAAIEEHPQRSEAEARLNKALARFEPVISKNMPPLLDAYTQAYAREFSGEELRQMIGFAESPAGKHFLSAFAAIESDQAVAEATANLMAKLAPVIQDIQKEMCAERAAQRVATGDTKAKCPLSGEAETVAG